MANIRKNTNNARTRARKNKARIKSYRDQVKKLHSSTWYYKHSPGERKEMDEKLNAFLLAFKKSQDYKEIQKFLMEFVDCLNLFIKETPDEFEELFKELYSTRGNLALDVAEFDKKGIFEYEHI